MDLRLRPLTWLRTASPDSMVHGKDVAELFGRNEAGFTARVRQQYPDFPAAVSTIHFASGRPFRPSFDRPRRLRGYRVGDLRAWIAKHDFPTTPSKD
jgi:hypothetical protein